MAEAGRIDPKTIFTDLEWAGLNTRSAWIGPALVAHCWAAIGLAAAMAVVWPLTLPLAVMIIGGRQLGLAILMHDATHRALHPNPKLNDFLGKWLCDPSLDQYRPYHLTHHRYAQQAEDPDLVLSAPFPITRASLKRKMIRDLTGQTYFKLRFGALSMLHVGGARPSRAEAIGAAIKARRRTLIGGAICTAALAPFGLWWAWLALWFLPSATWLPLVTRLRNIGEHACIPVDEPDPMRQARTTKAGFVERALIAPYWVNYHCEHHMFMYLPCYRLPQAHRMLQAKGLTGRMEVRESYADMLALAAPAGA